MLTLENSERFTVFNNRDDYISFVESKRNDFDCSEDWEYFFGFELSIDDEGEETQTVQEYAEYNAFTTEPTAYPCIVYCNIGSNEDRFGKFSMRIFDWAVAYVKEE